MANNPRFAKNVEERPNIAMVEHYRRYKCDSREQFVAQKVLRYNDVRPFSHTYSAEMINTGLSNHLLKLKQEAHAKRRKESRAFLMNLGKQGLLLGKQNEAKTFLANTVAAYREKEAESRPRSRGSSRGSSRSPSRRGLRR